MLAYKVEQPMKTKPPKREFANPLPKGQPFNKGSPSYPSKLETPSTSFLQKGQAPQNSQPPQNGPNPDPITPRSCFKCQGLRHVASECPNRKIISLPKWEDNKEEENREVCLTEEQKEVVENADVGGLVVLRRALSGIEDGKEITLAPLSPSKPHKSKPPNTQTHSDLFLTFSEPLLKASHHAFKVFKGSIRTTLDEFEAPIPTHPLAIDSYQAQANKHKRRTVFQPGDLVWIHLKKARFPSKRKSQLMPRADGPFEVHERVHDKAYKVRLPGDYGVLATFNVADLSPYFNDDHLANLRANSHQQGEDDGDDPPNDYTIMKEGERDSKEAKEVHNLVRKVLKQSNSALGSSPGN